MRTFVVTNDFLPRVGGINDYVANIIVAQLLFLDSTDKKNDITIYVNSPGGSVYDGLAIYDTMQHIRADVATICLGQCASMGAFLLSSGTKGKRMGLPNSRILIHQPLGGAQGQATDVRIMAEEILRMRSMFCPDITAGKILLIATHSSQGEEISRVLAALRPHLRVAVSSEAAVRAYGTDPPEIIVLDPIGVAGVRSDLFEMLRPISDHDLFRSAELLIWTDQLPQDAAPDDMALPDSVAWVPRQLGTEALLRCVRRTLSRRRAEAALAAELHRCTRALAAAHDRDEQRPQHQTRFLAAMSHELRTPLNAIIGFSELLQQELFGPLNPRQQKYVSNVLQSGHHLLKLINDILALSKTEAGGLTLRRSWISARQLVEQASDPARGLGSRRDVDLDVVIAPDVPELYLDPEQMRQVLGRLMLSAIERTPHGGRVALRITAQDGQLRVQVQDGDGEQAAHAAERVPRDLAWLPGPSEARDPKVSLDLALAQRLVEMHGGFIVLEGRPGQGSLCTVSLPLVRAAGARRARSVPPRSLDPTRVLVVEDDDGAGRR